MTRGNRRTIVGIVVSDKMTKSIVVKVERRVRHLKFGKYIKKCTKCVAHDEQNSAKEGDSVEIMEVRPMSKTKRWRLVNIIARAGERRVIASEIAKMAEVPKVGAEKQAATPPPAAAN
jgi:small subunit ribosomal protein S17